MNEPEPRAEVATAPGRAVAGNADASAEAAEPEAEPGRRILIVSPAKDEAEFIGRTIASMDAQTLRPALWVIVDDGSSDATGEIAEEAARSRPWIKVVRRPPGTGRRVGPGVVEAFHAGLEADGVDLDEFDYVGKFDADLELPPNYFRELVARFEADPKLGTASGKVYVPIGGKLVYERLGDDFSQGAAKLYRRECYRAIGGLVREVMWDGIDCHRCRQLGWKARSWNDPELRIVHFRLMGSSHRSVYHGRARWGRGQWFMGTHPLYILAIAGYRAMERPWIAGGLCILWGYARAWWTGAPRYDDPEFRKHLRAWQLDRLRRLFPPRRGRGGGGGGGSGGGSAEA